MKLRGFTIVEVVVAVAIVTLLAAIVIPDLWAAQQRITGEMFMNNVHDITTTLELYKKEHVGLYPTQLEELASYFDKQPINQYTKSSMLSSDAYQSGVQYTPSADRKSYTLVVTQRDVNDLDRDKNKTETVAEALGQPFSFVNVQPITPTVARTYIVTLRAVPNNTGQLVAFPNPAKAGQTVMLSQKPANCYNFGSWSSPDVTITNNSFVMPAQNVTATANYTIKTYTITASPNNASYGTVKITGAGTCGSTITLTASPNAGYNFDGWYEGSNSVTTATTYSFTVTGTRTLEARFNAILYNITLTASPAGAGSQSASPNPAMYGQTVTLSANPGACYNFSGWLSPDVTITNPLSPTASFIMPEKNATIIANYIIQKYTITATNVQYGTVTGTGTYNCGSTATLTAVPNTDYMFIGWYENGIPQTASTVYIFTVSSTRTLEARFKQVEYHTITIIEPTQTDFSSGTLANVTATNGNITLDGQNQPNKEIIQQNTPYILPDAFWNGSKYKYIVFATSTPDFTGGSGVSIINRRIANPHQTSDVGNSYEITSSTRITSITANEVTLSNFTYREGDIFWYGPWWNAAVAQTIPSGYDIAFAIGRTENLGTSSWVVRLDGVDTAFSTNVANHYFRAPINSSTSHSILVTYITGGKGIQFAYWGYAKAYPSSGTRTSPEYNISTAGTVESAIITWTANTPAGTSVTVETRVSLDSGATWSSWQTVASGSAVPGLPKGTNLANARIQLRQTLSTTNSAVTPQLLDITVKITSTSTTSTGSITTNVNSIP